MSVYFKQAIAFIITVSMLLLCCGCGTAVVNEIKYDKTDSSSFDGVKVSENDKFCLNFDDDYKRITLFDKVHNTTWSTTPADAMSQRYDESGSPVNNHPQLESPILVDYLDTETQNLNTAVSYTESIKEGNVSAKAIKNGIKVTYYFEELKISVPVEYVLTENGINISVITKEIKQKKFKVCRISVAPFMCSVLNTATDGYLFVPSGSGALIYPKETGIMPSTYSQEVYGYDAARLLESETKNTTENEIRMPVYGAKIGNKAMCAIITEGAESANIEVSVGASNIGFSGVYTTFDVRGYNWVESTYEYKRLYSDSLIENKLTVSYYPLYDKDADYVGIANVYRNYINEKYGSSDENKGNMISLKIIGGLEVKNTFLGVPYDDFYTATSIKDAKKIIEETAKNVSGSLAVDLIGFGKSGLDIGKIAGGYSINSKLGNKKDIALLNDYCDQEDIDLFVNFDVIQFGKSAKNANLLFDKAINVNGQSSIKYYYSIWSRTRNLKFDKYFLIKRSKLDSVADTLLKFADKSELSGVGFDTLSNMCYSDYSDSKTFVKGNMAKDVSAIMKKYVDKDLKIAVNDANDYSASFASQIIDAPLQSADFRVFDESVPFYEIVFSGYVPTSSVSVNLAANSDDLLLKIIETGCGLTFTVSNNYDTKLMDSAQSVFYGSKYSDVKPLIKEIALKYKEIYDKIGNTKIINHQIIDNGIRKTTFENGYSVYVNYNSYSYKINDLTIEAKGYIVEGE